MQNKVRRTGCGLDRPYLYPYNYKTCIHWHNTQYFMLLQLTCWSWSIAVVCHSQNQFEQWSCKYNDDVTINDILLTMWNLPSSTRPQLKNWPWCNSSFTGRSSRPAHRFYLSNGQYKKCHVIGQLDDWTRALHWTILDLRGCVNVNSEGRLVQPTLHFLTRIV